MTTRFLAAIIVCLTLTGCILQSKTPLFTDEQGELILATYGRHFATYSLDGGSWKKDEGMIGLTPASKHYVMAEGKTTVAITFAAIADSWWVMQVQEAGKPVSYSLVDAQKGEIFLHPLNCGLLRKSGKFDGFITFEGEDCSVKDGADATAMFKSLAAEPRQPDMKLVPLP